MTIRRIRRAGAGGGGNAISNPTSNTATSRPERRGSGIMARGDEEQPSVTSNITNATKSKIPRGGTPIMSLSEKLRQQELLEQQQQQQQQQQNQNQGVRRGPLLDSDHIKRKQPLQSQAPPNSGNRNDDDSGGWSWNSSSRGNKMYNNNNNNMANFGETTHNVIQQKVMSVVNCTKNKELQFNNDDDEWGDAKQIQGFRARMVKLGMAIVLLFLGVFQFGRRRGRRLGERSALELESSFSVNNDQYNLRGGNLNNNFVDRGNMDNMNSMGIGGALINNNNNNMGSMGGVDPNNLNNINNPNLPPDNIIIHQATFPPHLSHLSNLTTSYDPSSGETPYFWDVHFSGESIAEVVFAQCHGLVMAAEFGLRQTDYNEDKLEVFQLDETQYVNVDTTSQEGIQRASQLGLASSRLADVIISPHFHGMASQIFSPRNPGRMFALFRHPVDRSLSMYYYLAKASWDPYYNPNLAKMSIEQYAKSRYIENNWLTRFLVGKPGGKLKHADMLLAKKIIKFKCLVGLYDDIEVSMARFQRYFGWNSRVAAAVDGSSGSNKNNNNDEGASACRADAVLRGDKNVEHPTVREGSVAWNAIARMNVYDMELYEYAKKIYGVQGEQIFDVVGHEVVRHPASSAAGARGGVGGGGDGDDVGRMPDLTALGEVSSSPLRSGNSMAADAFEEEMLFDTRSSDSVAFDSGKYEEPADRRSGKSMSADAFENGLFDPQDVDGMELDSVHD